jgi:membrane associated rhomboid family serine protease
MFRHLTPAVRWLLVANVGVFALQWMLPGALEVRFALWPWHGAERYGMPSFAPWQLVSYAYLHGGFEHIFFNMFAVYMFGPELERLLGARRFNIYYLVCVVGAAVTQLAVQELFAQSVTGPTVGASGGVFGLLLLFGMAYPQRRLMLIFPPIPMPAWLFVTLYGLAELLMGVFSVLPGIAHFAHLGGMAAGYLLIRYWHAVSLARRGD